MGSHGTRTFGARLHTVEPPCPRCGCSKIRHLSRCPLCAAELPSWNERPVNRWLRSGALEAAVIVLVAAVLVVSWLVVLGHR
jgi:tRNA(Ile2) C34 agmatinyltransferase TiaS